MIDALGVELDALRRQGGGSRVDLRGGEYVGRAEASWVYRFVVEEDLNLRDDTPVRVTVDQVEVHGFLVSFRDGALLVALEKDLGPTIAAARLLADNAFLIEHLKTRLEEVCNGEAQFNRSASERALGIAPPQTADAEPHALVTEDGPIDPDQLQAVRRSLGSDQTFIWGPPGTGKTVTLARIVEAHYRAGCSVLLVSNTNIAVDTALERVAERLSGDPDFHQGLVIRRGPVVKEELRQRFGSQVILEEILARLGESERRERETLKREGALLEAEKESLSEKLKCFKRLADEQASLAAREKTRSSVASTIAARHLETEKHRATCSRLLADLDRAQKMWAIRRFFAGLDLAKLKHDVAKAERDANATVAATRSLADKLTRLDASIGENQSNIKEYLFAVRGLPNEAELQGRVDTLCTHLGQLCERIDAIDRELVDLEQQTLARCKVLATTAYRTYLGSKALRQFDAVVIDEASMLMPPLVYYVAGLAKRSVTITGDFRQLSPITKSKDPLVADWLKRDVFEIACIPQRLRQHLHPPHLVVLRTQFRMQEPICAVINKLFYNDYPLTTGPDPLAGENFPLGTAPLLYVDTARFHPWTTYRVGTHSRYNLLHALLIQKIVLYLAEAGFLAPVGTPNNKIGVVTPYAWQARLIQTLLNDRLGSRAAGIAATVHRFQGNEKQAMVLDLTDSYGTPLSNFLRATRLEEDGARLLNVAVSRAKHHVILVGNFAYLRAAAPDTGFVRQLVDYFVENGEAPDLDLLLPLTEGDWLGGLRHVLSDAFTPPANANAPYTEGTFYPAFLNDLTHAHESITIISPFATVRGTGRWVNLLRLALSRRVRVCVVTRPPEEPNGIRLVSRLREIGVEVILRDQTHEKVAILDKRTLWHGSLNILSHNNTRESMLRIDSPEMAQQIGAQVGVPMYGHG